METDVRQLGTVAVTGATGTVGSAVVEELAARGVRPVALLRPGRRNEQIERIADLAVADFEQPATLTEALAGVERLFLLTPLHPRQNELQRALLAAAREAGVGYVVKVSALGADPDAATTIHRQHGETDRLLVDSGVTCAILRPNAFMQNVRQWQGMLARHNAVMLPTAGARVSWIDARDIAAVAAHALVEPEPRTVFYDLTGPEALDYHELAAQISEVLGRPIGFVNVPPEEAASHMSAAGMPEWAVKARMELYATYRAGEAERVTSTVADVLGRSPRHFATVLNELAPQLCRALAQA